MHDRDTVAAQVILLGSVPPVRREPAGNNRRKRGAVVRGGALARASASHGEPPSNVAAVRATESVLFAKAVITYPRLLRRAMMIDLPGVDTIAADLIALARVILFNPRWPWHAAAHFGAQVQAPDQYLRSQPRQYRDLFDIGH